MGSSTSAMLFYGLCWQEHTSLLTTLDEDGDTVPREDLAVLGNDPDIEHAYALLVLGIMPPAAPFPDGVYNYQRGGYDHTAEERVIVDEHYAYRARCRGLLAGIDINAGTHGYDSEPWPYIAIASSIVDANDDPAEVEPRNMKHPTDDNDHRLREFCATMKIDITGMRIGWWLTASYG